MCKPYVVTIAGGTCGGKSTLADRLKAALEKEWRVKSIHMDRYFKEEPPTTVAPITRKTYVEHNHPDSLDLSLLYADFAKALDSRDYDILLVEGLFALYLDALREKADYRVFVDLDSDARLARRIQKHMSWGQSYEQVTERYLETVKFRHNELIEPTRWHADVVINGTLDQNKGTETVLCYLQNQLQISQKQQE